MTIGAFSVGENELIRSTRAKEVASPTSPPRMAMTTDSTRIWMKMSLVAAPTDLRMPISRTRSEMLASMMFMMPMPPTSRLMPAISPPLSRAFADEGVDLLRPVLLGAEGEILDARCACSSARCGSAARPPAAVSTLAIFNSSWRAADRRWRQCWRRRPPAAAWACAGTELHPHGVQRNIDGGVLEVENEAAAPPPAAAVAVATVARNGAARVLAA